MLIFHAEDIALILGLPLSGVAIDMKKALYSIVRTTHFVEGMVRREALEDRIKYCCLIHFSVPCDPWCNCLLHTF